MYHSSSTYFEHRPKKNREYHSVALDRIWGQCSPILIIVEKNPEISENLTVINPTMNWVQNMKGSNPSVAGKDSNLESSSASNALSMRNIVLLYFLENVLFTRWPYSMRESIYSYTNLIGPTSLFAIRCLLCSFARLGMYGTNKTAQTYWQYTTTVRKLAAVVYYSSVLFVLFVICCTVITIAIRRRFRRGNPELMYLKTVLYVPDSIFVAYIVVIALLNKCMIFILPYVVYYFFLHMHAEIRYIFINFYLLALFPMFS